MASERKEVPLGQLYDFRSGLSKPRSEFGSGHEFLSFKDVFYNIFVPNKLTNLVNSTEQERQLCSIKRGDVFLTRTSETMEELGMSCVALSDYDGATFNGFSKRLRPKSGTDIVPEYAGYFFRSPKFRHEVTAMSSLSTRASLNNEMLARLTIALPPTDEQAAIAHILKSFDDKIELNRRMNETLEAMARALFKSWFVDFDPVRAKMAGRWRPGQSLAGLPAKYYDLFPNRLVDSELGEIPEGWKVGAIEDLAEVSSGKRPGVKYAEASDLAQVLLWGGNGPMAFVPEPLVKYPILLTGRVGTLGSIFRITSPCWPSDNTLIFKVRHKRAFEFLFFQLKRIDFTSLNRGSTQPLVTQTNLKAQTVLLPPASVLERFHTFTKILYARLDKSESESRILTALRDALLPKLVSGELRVKDAKRFVVEECT